MVECKISVARLVWGGVCVATSTGREQRTCEMTSRLQMQPGTTCESINFRPSEQVSAARGLVGAGRGRGVTVQAVDGAHHETSR